MSLRHLALVVVTALFALVTLRRARTSRGNPLLAMVRDWFRATSTTPTLVAIGLGIGASVVLLPMSFASARGLVSFHRAGPADGALPLALASLALIVVWAAIEEFVFRGAVLSVIAEWTNAATGIVASGALFALAHVGTRGGAFEDPYSIAIWLLDGVAFGLAFLASGTLWLPTAWHAGKNLAVWLALDGSTLAVTSGLFRVTYGAESELAGRVGRASVLDVVATCVATLAVLAVVVARRRAGRSAV